jgi:hypothetical protein
MLYVKMFPCWYEKPPQESAQKMTQFWRGRAISCEAGISRVLNQQNEREKAKKLYFGLIFGKGFRIK